MFRSNKLLLKRIGTENSALLGYYAASSGNLPTFRHNLWVPSSGVKNSNLLDSWPLKMGSITCRETSVNYRNLPHKNPEEQFSSALQRKPKITHSIGTVQFAVNVHKNTILGSQHFGLDVSMPIVIPRVERRCYLNTVWVGASVDSVVVCCPLHARKPSYVKAEM
jgi:hypothetical protein